MSNVRLSSTKDLKIDENVLEYLKISESLDTEVQSKGDLKMLDNLIDMFNYSYKVADQWEDLPENFNLLEADLDLNSEDFEDSDSEYSDEDETESLHNLNVKHEVKTGGMSFSDLAKVQVEKLSPKSPEKQHRVNVKQIGKPPLNNRRNSTNQQSQRGRKVNANHEVISSSSEDEDENLIDQSRKSSARRELHARNERHKSNSKSGSFLHDEDSDLDDEDDDLIQMHKEAKQRSNHTGSGNIRPKTSSNEIGSSLSNKMNFTPTNKQSSGKTNSILQSKDSIINKKGNGTQGKNPVLSQKEIEVEKDKLERQTTVDKPSYDLTNSPAMGQQPKIQESYENSRNLSKDNDKSNILKTNRSALKSEVKYHLHRGNTSISNIYDIDSNPSQAILKTYGDTTLNVPSQQSITKQKAGQNSAKAQLGNMMAMKKKQRLFKQGSSVRSITSQTIRENKAKITYDDDGDKKINQYRVIHLLGQGAFGKVKLVQNEDDKLSYAMKIQSKKKMKKVALKTGKDSFNLLQKETAIMKKIFHDNLIQLFEIIDDPDKGKLYFIMDYMDLGYLGSTQHMAYINNKHKYLPDDKLLKYFRDCIKGIDYCKNFTFFGIFANFCQCTILPESSILTLNRRTY